METLSFTLGVLAVIDLLIVAGTFLVLKTLNITRKQTENTQRELQDTVAALYREIERVEQQLSTIVYTKEEQCIRHTDSRVDKLRAEIEKNFDIKGIQSKQYM